MKTMKKLAALMLAVLLLASVLTVPVFAEDNYSITITNTNANHTFTAYQIFSGDLAAGILSNVTWGNGVNGTSLLAALKASTDPLFMKEGVNIFASSANAADVAKALETYVTTVAATDAFAKIVAENLTATGATGTLSGTDYAITGLAAGYYIVTDTGSGVGEATSKYMIQVSSADPDVKVAVKMDAPTMVKTVGRNLNLTYTEAISASYGDVVYFKLEGKMHTRLDDYQKYYYQIVDTLPDGLSFKQIESVEVVNGVNTHPVNDGYIVDQTGSTLTITFDDIKSVVETASGVPAVADDYVVVKYSATVNNGTAAVPAAVVGQTGNENKVVLKYSSDPNNPANYATTTGTTAVDTAYVYCYQVAIDKIEGTNAAAKLKDAKFVLYRVTTGNEYAVVDANGRLTEWANTEAGGTELITDANGAVSVIGLASGTYYLKETKAPEGYNTLEDIISVTVNASANGITGALESLTASTTHGGQASTVLADGKVTVTIGNNKGAVLPSTGGMGTTIFYIAGGALVLCAIVVLAMKKRSAEG